MDKEFLNNLFLWLAEQFQKDVGGQFGFVNEEGPIENLYKIVDEPEGDKQEYNDTFLENIPDEYKFITHEYVDQYQNGGYTGDDFAGYVYYPLPDGKFMKVHYSC